MEISSLPQDQAIWPSKSGYLRSEVSDCRKQARTRSQKLVVRLLLAFNIQISVRSERARLETRSCSNGPEHTGAQSFDGE